MRLSRLLIVFTLLLLAGGIPTAVALTGPSGASMPGAVRTVAAVIVNPVHRMPCVMQVDHDTGKVGAPLPAAPGAAGVTDTDNCSFTVRFWSKGLALALAAHARFHSTDPRPSYGLKPGWPLGVTGVIHVKTTGGNTIQCAFVHGVLTPWVKGMTPATPYTCTFEDLQLAPNFKGGGLELHLGHSHAFWGFRRPVHPAWSTEVPWTRVPA